MAKERKRRSATVKSTTKKAPTKRSKSSRKKGTLKKDFTIFTTVIVMIAMVVLGYYIGRGEAGVQPNPNSILLKSSSDNKALFESLEKVKNERALREQKRQDELELKLQIQREAEQKKAALEAQKEEEKQKLLEKSKSVPYPGDMVHYNEMMASSKSEKPKLVIIIDDVSSRSQLEHIQAVNLKLTPSIFPPYKLSPSNNKLAEGLKHYMIHLPMQSGKAYDKQEKTLMVTDTPEMIESRVKELRRLFPTARFVNNHTGSVFTSNYLAMDRLYQALYQEGFVFIDSRTISATKVPQISRKHSQLYMARDVFIDNKQTVDSIHKQLKLAVNIAKKRGYTIVIGHPHKVTLEALSSATEMLKDVETVYIDELYQLKVKR
ncbi:divergent polysaccharide deacetylase family protein [Sulfurovum sp. zt1-1]|uniref:Divergent polysaccharide deacetylase family protein n=1 Tax=Sulfurovum zhangzhouensis TaxID=3019067 RepID=A0ABT7R0U4_9BACT|nr:divergent polysaccharide deacetylase family protein [Sulfurovum zhangzhouensis]MDM5272717.1 divergent polysaccharide deacetylase family protein [Sulfurovum zhangzhouensis]